MILEKEDPIVAEVREARHRLAAFYGNDIRKIAEAAARGFTDYRDSNCISDIDSCQEQLFGNVLAIA